jgi:hypothetical protein
MLDYVLLLLAICLAMCAVAALCLRAAARSRKASRPCRHCGYDLATIDNVSVCPECGNGFCSVDGRLYFGRYRALIRSLGILLLAATGTFGFANADLPTYRVLWADMQWLIQSVAGDSSADSMLVVGQSTKHPEWSLDKTGERGAAGAAEPLSLPAGVAMNLKKVEFHWRGMSLTIVKNPASGQWRDVNGERVGASDILKRLNAPSDFEEYMNALLTLNWFNGDLRAFYESKAYHKPGEYGPGNDRPFLRNRQPFHYMGYSWGWDAYRIGLYTTWGLIWVVAAGLIFLCFWVDRQKPLRKQVEATLPA